MICDTCQNQIDLHNTNPMAANFYCTYRKEELIYYNGLCDGHIEKEDDKMADKTSVDELYNIIDEVLIENRVPKEFRDYTVRSIIGRCSRAGYINIGDD